MVARRGGEVYSSLCLFELFDTNAEFEALRRKRGSLRHDFGLEELARIKDDDARSLHGLDIVVTVSHRAKSSRIAHSHPDMTITVDLPNSRPRSQRSLLLYLKKA